MSELGNTFIEIINSISIIGVYIYQEKGKIVFTNKAFAKLLGYSNKELLSLTIFDILYKEQEYIKNIVKRRLQGEHFSKEYNELYYKTKSGFIKPTLNFGYTIEYNGKPAGLVIVIDSTQQKLYSTLYESLANIMFIATTSQNEEELIRKVVNTLVHVGEFDLVVVGTIDDKTKLFKPTYLKAKRKEHEEFFRQSRISVDENLPEGKGSIGEAYRKSSVVVINNIYKDERLKYWRDIQKKTGVHSVCSFPVSNRKYIMTLYSKIPEIFNKQFLKLILNIQTVISSSIERINSTKWKNLLNQAINQSFEIVIIMDKHLNILYTNKNTEIITGFQKEELLNKKLNALFEINGIDVTKITNFHGIVPCKRKKKEKIDVLLNVSKIKEDNREEFYIATGKDITENTELQRAIDEVLNKDQLTGLLNRNAFIKAIDKFIKRAKHKNVIGAVVVINPVNFSTINKALGFNKANLIFKQIGERLINFLREYDTVAKLESDRFGVLIKDINREEDIFVIVKRLLEILSKSYKIDTNNLVIGFSAGISIFPYDSKNAEELIEKAEIALPETKEKTVNFGFYRDSLKEKFEKRIKIESEFFKALKENKFIFFFQPYVNSENLAISGAEALIRWKKGDKIVQPMEFIPILEEMKLIKDLESWIIKNKLSCIKTLTDLNTPIALNISPVNLNDDIFVEKLIKETELSKINPELVRIEITERMFIENIKKATKTLEKLKDNGFKIMVDDFGTGYSSLSYLANLPLDFVKIDISFVKDILTNKKKLTVVKTIIFISKDLGIKTVAEGVETEEQASLLRELGCDYLQGFYFYRPLPQEEFLDILNKDSSN